MGVKIALDVPGEEENRDWFTAAELAALRLPGLPADKGAMNRRIRDERWQLRTDQAGALLSRPRVARGGGTEYHVSLLPGPARLELARRGIGARPAPGQAQAPASGSWAWYDRQSDTTKAEATRRMGIVAEIELLKQSGASGTAAVDGVSCRYDVGTATLWNWLKLVKGVARQDWLPALAPRRKGGGSEADIDPDLWHHFKSNMLRGSAPTYSECYADTAEIAAARGLSLPSERTMRRRLVAEVDPAVFKLAREGEEKLRRSIPAGRRRVDELAALEWVNIDGHTFDVWVMPPNAGKDAKPIRPVMVALQDVLSSKVLAWRIGESESAALARLAFADLFANWGIPQHCTLDNGRGFASKWLTGGAKTRFRFKILDSDPTGLLTGLGIGIHWALPFRGQSKPIERAFRDLCNTIAKAPEAEGAYTGNSPVNKPHNYGSRAMSWEAFVDHVARGIARHNRKLGRKGRHYAGRSFDQVFAESYADGAKVGKATPETMRMALLAAEQKRVNRQTSELELFGNRYWCEAMDRLRGEMVTVRFDPDNLHSEVHLYGQDGGYLTTAQLLADTGFGDVEGAKATGKRWAEWRRRARAGLEAEQLLAADQIAAMRPDAPEPIVADPKVVRAVRHRGQTAAALRVAHDRDQQQHENLAQFGKAMSVLRLVDDNGD